MSVQTLCVMSRKRKKDKRKRGVPKIWLKLYRLERQQKRREREADARFQALRSQEWDEENWRRWLASE